MNKKKIYSLKTKLASLSIKILDRKNRNEPYRDLQEQYNNLFAYIATLSK
jgi:hypothetical protein